MVMIGKVQLWEFFEKELIRRIRQNCTSHAPISLMMIISPTFSMGSSAITPTTIRMDPIG